MRSILLWFFPALMISFQGRGQNIPARDMERSQREVSRFLDSLSRTPPVRDAGTNLKEYTYQYRFTNADFDTSRVLAAPFIPGNIHLSLSYSGGTYVDSLRVRIRKESRLVYDTLVRDSIQLPLADGDYELIVPGYFYLRYPFRMGERGMDLRVHLGERGVYRTFLVFSKKKLSPQQLQSIMDCLLKTNDCDQRGLYVIMDEL